jgi:adenosylmethionine-8-amino-7-oxononanoate aminotransferase
MVAKPLSGEKIEELKGLGETHYWPHSRPTGDLSDDTGIKIVTHSEGIWVEGPTGERHVDLIAGMWLKNIGHGRKEIADAVYAQMQDISYAPGGTVAPSTIELAAKVASLTPDPESRVYFVSGGSEAVETAIKMAKKYQFNQGERGRYKVISRQNSYHGATHLCMSLGFNSVNRPNDYGPLVPGNIRISNPGVDYRTRSGDWDMQYAADLERAIISEGPDSVAAFIGEPISAASGIHIPHPEYWPTIREICDKYGVLLIADEVINGFGRTGKMFAVEHWGIKPDIMTVAKALTSGYLPIGAAIASKKVGESMEGSGDQSFRHLITFGGNPPACAAGLVNLDIIEREGLVQNSADLGTYLYEQLQTLKEHPIVADVRGGMGLLAAVEFAKDPATFEPFPDSVGLDGRLGNLMEQHQLLGRGMNQSMFYSPPLSITKDEIDFVVGQTEKVVTQLEKDIS